MATTLVEPFTPWLRELGQFLPTQGTVGAFVPPADLLIDDDGVTASGSQSGRDRGIDLGWRAQAAHPRTGVAPAAADPDQGRRRRSRAGGGYGGVGPASPPPPCSVLGITNRDT